MKLEPTGERMILEHYRSSPQDYVIYLLHMATYRFAEDFARGKRVLDYGCGSGYGSAHIAEVASHVTGVDVAADAIGYASEQFPLDNAAFELIDPSEPLPFADGSFDVVLSFQVFEHVPDPDHYLAEIRRVLAPGGQLVMATPDRSTRLLPMQRPWNRWHLHEYSDAELGGKLRAHFHNVEIFGMGGKREVIDIEIDRCRKLKWMTLPFTLPVMPDAWRVAALNMIHRLRGTQARGGESRNYPYTIDDITIAPGVSPSLNLVAVAS